LNAAEEFVAESRRRSKRIVAALLAGASVGLLASTQTGCLLWKQHPAATQPATARVNPKTTQPSYWLDQPGVAHVSSRNFDALWDACRNAMRDDGFILDRRDYREGLLTSQPLVSKMAYEFWRGDVASAHELAQSSLAMLRRTVHFTITRKPDGSFDAVPRVLVERNSLIGQRITSVDQYQNAFAIQPQDVARETEKSGTDIPAEYWYLIARDTTLEKQLAQSVRDTLR
jgi:hypothetical protein